MFLHDANKPTMLFLNYLKNESKDKGKRKGEAWLSTLRNDATQTCKINGTQMAFN